MPKTKTGTTAHVSKLILREEGEMVAMGAENRLRGWRDERGDGGLRGSLDPVPNF